MNLYAVHDYDAAWAQIITGAGKSGWAVTTHALGTNPADRSGYDFNYIAQAGITPIARLNNGYEPVGTIPGPGDYPAFAQRVANFVDASPGCIRWIIGNEPTNAVERPYGAPISAQQYAQCFVMCRNLVKQRGLHNQVIVAPVGPWNTETGDWIAWMVEALKAIAANGGADGIAIHSYLRGSNPAGATSDEKMQSPGYTDRYANFRAYIDLMNAIPAALRSLPVYMTEVDEYDAWTDANTGAVKAIYDELNRWNRQPGTQKILCAALYRWPVGLDKWGFANKAGVISDFREAVAVGYLSPSLENTRVETPIVSDGPTVPPKEGQSMPTQFVPEIDPRLIARGVHFEILPPPSGPYWRITRARWYNEQEADGIGPDHHILGEVIKGGSPQAGVTLQVSWPSGSAPVTSKDDDPHASFNYDFPMSKSLKEYTVKVTGAPSDIVSGLGMGADGNPSIHTSTWLDWELVVVDHQTVPAPESPSHVNVPLLVHPIADPASRVIEQGFGGNQSYYSQFAVDGVALKGHNGLDFRVPVGTPVRAVANGTVREAWYEPGGYGNLILLDHDFGQSLYAHLDGRVVEPGDTVNAGETIAKSGATGRVTGPHLHFGLRVFPYSRMDGWGGYIDPAPHLAAIDQVTTPPTPAPAPAPVVSGLIDPKIFAAIIAVESRGLAYGPANRMIIRFEPHIFMERVPFADFTAHFLIGDPIWDGNQHLFKDPADGMFKRFHGDQGLEYKAFAEAQKVNTDAAYESISMGKGQVMGFNARRVGFGGAAEMFRALQASGDAQTLAVVNFMLTDDNLRQAMLRRDFETVARLYNGAGNVEAYAKLMRDEYAKLG